MVATVTSSRWGHGGLRHACPTRVLPSSTGGRRLRGVMRRTASLRSSGASLCPCLWGEPCGTEPPTGTSGWGRISHASRSMLKQMSFHLRYFRRRAFKRVLLSFCREVQKMRVPVVSKAESWRRRNTKLLRKSREAFRDFLYFFSPWRKALQLIGGESGMRPEDHGFFSLPMRQLKRTFVPQETLAVVSSPSLCCCDFWCCSIFSPFCWSLDSSWSPALSLPLKGLTSLIWLVRSWQRSSFLCLLTQGLGLGWGSFPLPVPVRPCQLSSAFPAARCPHRIWH